MNPVLTILKIGGNILDMPQDQSEVLATFADIPAPRILVHGGGRRSSEISKKMGITPNMAEGRRITDQDTLEVVTMVYAGLINKNLVARLQSMNCQSIGLSGADGNAIQARKRALGEIDYGYAGDIVSVNANLINGFLQQAITPVFCSITHDLAGQLLNTNADTIAAHIAVAMTVYYDVRLLFCFEKDGVLTDPTDERSVITRLSEDLYSQYRQSGTIRDGMVPKLDNAFYAKRSGVQKVVICGQQGIAAQTGTEICL